MGSALSSVTTFLSLTLCDGSSRKLIAGWWYVFFCLFELVHHFVFLCVERVICIYAGMEAVTRICMAYVWYYIARWWV